MSDDGSTDERSALAWVMSGTVGALVVGGFAKRLIDKRRDRAFTEAAELEAAELGENEQDETEQDETEQDETEQDETQQDENPDLDEVEGHPS